MQPHVKFLILATDGLWEQMQTVVQVLGEHLSSEETSLWIGFYSWTGAKTAAEEGNSCFCSGG